MISLITIFITNKVYYIMKSSLGYYNIKEQN